MYTFFLDEEEPGVWEHPVFTAVASHLASRLRVRTRSVKAFATRPGRWPWGWPPWPGPGRGKAIELHHNLAVLQDVLSRDYWVLDGNDWVTPFNEAIPSFVRDRRCRAVLKCQYERAPYERGALAKVRPWTYFETHAPRFQALLGELRAAPRTRAPLFFRGNASWANRQAILERLAGRGLVNPDFALWVSYERHARELAEHRLVLGLEGMGPLCHREIEAFGAGTPVLMPRLRVELHEPLVPDRHYVSVDANVYDDPPEEVAGRIEARYRQAVADPGFLDEVAREAMAWYDRNVRMPASLELTGRLMGLWD